MGRGQWTRRSFYSHLNPQLYVFGMAIFFHARIKIQPFAWPDTVRTAHNNASRMNNFLRENRYCTIASIELLWILCGFVTFIVCFQFWLSEDTGKTGIMLATTTTTKRWRLNTHSACRARYLIKRISCFHRHNLSLVQFLAFAINPAWKWNNAKHTHNITKKKTFAIQKNFQ